MGSSATRPDRRFVFGGAAIGSHLLETVTAEQARATLETAWELGVRTFDVAPSYGLGLAEHRLGAFLQSRPRDEYTLSTKIGRLLAPSAGATESGGSASKSVSYSADGVRRSISESLKRLGLDRVDIALIHDPENHLPEAAGSAVPELVRMKNEGTIAAFGVGTNFVETALRFVDEAPIDVVLIAGKLTLLDHSALAMLSSRCSAAGVTLWSAGVFHSGILAAPDTNFRFDYQPAAPDVMARVRALSELCQSYSTTLAAAALRYPLLWPDVGAVVVGAASPNQITQNLESLDAPIDPGLWRAIGVPTP